MEEEKKFEDNNELRILKVSDPPNFKMKPYPKILPNPYGSLLVLYGSVKSGKSTILNNLALNPSFYNKDLKNPLFDRTLVISNTILNDNTMRFMRDTFEYKSMYNDGDITTLLEQQKSFGERAKMPLVWLIADDILSTSFKKNNELSFLASRFRHYNIFYTITSQNMRSLSPVIRSNTTHAIICKQQSDNELNKIVEEYAPMYKGEKNFRALYQQAINYEPYSFLYLKLDENPAEAYISFFKRIH